MVEHERSELQKAVSVLATQEQAKKQDLAIYHVQ